MITTTLTTLEQNELLDMVTQRKTAFINAIKKESEAPTPDGTKIESYQYAVTKYRILISKLRGL